MATPDHYLRRKKKREAGRNTAGKIANMAVRKVTDTYRGYASSLWDNPAPKPPAKPSGGKMASGGGIKKPVAKKPNEHMRLKPRKPPTNARQGQGPKPVTGQAIYPSNTTAQNAKDIRALEAHVTTHALEAAKKKKKKKSGKRF